MSEEIGGLLVNRNATAAGAVGAGVFPNVVAVKAAIIAGIAGVLPSVAVSAVSGCGLLIVPRGVGATDNGAVKPLSVVRVARSSRVGILGSAVARIGRRQGSSRLRPRHITPRGLLVSVGRRGSLATLHARQALILGNLLLMPRGVHVLVASTGNVGIDGGDESSKTFAAGLVLLALLGLLPLGPIVEPGIVVFALVQIDVENPADGSQPLVFQSVQIANWDATDLRPRLVLESVVIKKLASEKKSDGQETPNLALVLDCTSGHHVDALGEVVETEQNGSPGKTSRRQYPRNVLPESRVHRVPWHHHAGGHLGNIVGHELDIVVENSANASRHVDGMSQDRRVESVDLSWRTASRSWTKAG